MFFFNWPEYDSLEESDHISTFKHLSSRQYSFQKLNKFSQRNKMLDAVPSKIGGLAVRDSCVCSLS